MKAKEAHCSCKGPARRIHLFFIWPETISMEGLVCEKWTYCPGYLYKGGLLQFARKINARFINLIENEIVSLVSIETQFRLLVKFSIIRDPEAILRPLFLLERPPFDF